MCKECGVEFDYGRDSQKQFCNRSCSATFNNRLRGGKICEHCGKEYKGFGKKYCSSFCSNKRKTANIVVAWIENPDSATQIQGLSKSIKKHLIEQSNFQCSQCGWGEVNPATGRSPLEVDHIDGDCYNNDPSNLRVLCPNCHALTPTYKALNKGGKRKYR
jgi:Tfp pilus assembly protein PilV